MRLKIKKNDLILALLFLLPDQFSFFINKSTFHSIFRIKYNDFVLVIYVLFFIYLIIKDFSNSFKKKYSYTWILLFSFVMAFMGAYVPYKMFGQGFKEGFLVQRTFWVFPLIYLIFRIMLENKMTSPQKLLKVVYYVGNIVTIFCVIQAMLYPLGIRFLDATFRERNGLRIRSNVALPIIVILYSVEVLIKKTSKKERQFAWFSLIFNLFFIIFIQQTRMQILGLAIAIFIIVILNKEQVSKKIIWLAFLFIAIALLANTPLGDMIIGSINATASQEDIRAYGREYYITKLKSNYWFGYGYPHESSLAAETAAGYYVYKTWGYILSDNGIFAFAYIYGIIGVIWFSILHIKLLFNSFALIKNHNYLYFAYIIYLLSIILSLIFWYYNFSSLVVFSMMIAIIDYIFYEYKKQRMN